MNRIFSLLLCSLFSVAVYGQVNVKDSLQRILQNDTMNAGDRCRNAVNLISYNSPPDEAEMLTVNVVYPFVQKNWKEEKEKLFRLAQLQLTIAMCHRERGGDDRIEKESLYAKQAVETAKQSGHHAYCAWCLTYCGFMELKRGKVSQSHDYLYEAITYYDKAERYSQASEMLYVIASSFIDIKDTDALKRILGQMEYYFSKDTSRQSQYQYNVVKLRYFTLSAEKEKTEKGTVNYSLVDSAMVYIRKNIHMVENYLEELSMYWLHGYAYYYLSEVVNDYYPEQTDTIFRYLDKALAMFEKESFSRTVEANGAMEFQIYINSVRAKALARKGNTQAAYRAMKEALSLLDQLKNYKNLDVMRYNAYQFMADFYEKTNLADALKFQKLLRESEAQRYENEKVQAINDMSVKYETEKKEMQLQGYKTAQRNLWLAIGLLIMLLVASFFVMLSNRLKRKNAEQQLYEMALLAELRQNEREKILSTKQHLEHHHYHFQKAIEKLGQDISASLIDAMSKQTYLERLPMLDVQQLKNATQRSSAKLTAMDMKYIICFAADMNVKDIGLLFDTAPASVRTVRYRIRKKFTEKDIFQEFL